MSRTAATFEQAREAFEAAGVPAEADRSRLSGVARSTRLDHTEVCGMGAMREVSIAEAE